MSHSRRRQGSLYSTVPEALEKIYHLEQLCDRMPTLYGYQSADVPKAVRRLISLSNSLAIVFLQAEVSGLAYEMLKTAAIADLRLKGDRSQLTWTSRVLTYNCLAYLFEKYSIPRARDHSAAMKFSYKAHSLLLAYTPPSAQDRGVRRDSQVTLATNLFTFVVLWRARQYRDAYGYAQVCSHRVAQNSLVVPVSDTAYRGFLNVMGLVIMAMAGCYVRVEKNIPKALSTLEGALPDLEGKSLPVAVLVSTLLKDLQSLPSDTETPAQTPLRALEYVPLMQDWLVTPAYLSLVFITTFLPSISDFHVDPATPIIRRKELEAARVREDGGELARLLGTQGDHYTLFTNLVIARARELGVAPKPEDLGNSSKLSPRRPRRKRGLREIEDFSQDWTIAQYHTARHASLPKDTERTPMRRSAVGRSRVKERIPRSVETREGTRDFSPNRSEIVDVHTLPMLKDAAKTLGPETLRRIERVQDISIRSSPPRNEDTDESSHRDLPL